MKPPYHIGAVCIAMALAACSGAQSGSIANPVPAVGAPQTSSMTGASAPNVTKGQRLAGAHSATTALILVANENTGLGGSIREYAESANGNVAPSTVISNHNGGPYAIAFSPSQGIGIANGNIDSSGQSGPKRSGWPAIS